MGRRTHHARQMVPGTDRERATGERLAKTPTGSVEITEATSEAPRGVQRISAAPLDHLRLAGRITQREFEAGDRLRADAYLARIDPGAGTVTFDAAAGKFGSRPPSMFSAQLVFEARMDFRQVAKAFTGAVWDCLHLALIHEKDFAYIGREVIGVRGAHHTREAHVAGQAGLRVALAALADWYEN